MTNVKLYSVAALAVCLGACGDPVPRTETEIEPATLPDPVITDATRRIPLQDMVGGEVTGELIVTPFPDSVVFHIDVNGAAPETTYGVRIQPGACESPGEVAAVLEAVRTGALGNGSARRALQEDARQVLDGRHVVAIYAPTAEAGSDRPLACAQVPAIQ